MYFPLNNSFNQLPLILAGPILRRTEPDAVTVWVALQRPCTIALSVFATCDRGETLASTLLQGSCSTVAVGQRLHIAAVTARSLNSNLLQPGQLYAYDLTFDPVADGSSQTLQQALTSPLESNPTVSYFAHQLPTFSLPPQDTHQLRLVHGSCRKLHGKGYDTLPILDDLIQHSADSPNVRPHQLFLTGDQIYGDDVADPLLAALTPLGEALLGWEETLPIASATSDSAIAKLSEFKPGSRSQIAENQAGFTAGLHNKASYAKSHLLGFGEYCAIYLFAWSPVLWAKFWAMDEAARRLNSTTSEPVSKELQTGNYDSNSKRANAERRTLHDFVHTVWKVRRALANVPTYMVFDDHDISDDWNLNQAWCLRVLGKPLGRRVVQNGLLAYALFQAWGNTPDQFRADQPGQYLLDAVEHWSKSQGSDETSWAAIARYLGLPATDPMTGLPRFRQDGECWVLDHDPEALTWNYRVRGACHEVIVLDTRTWRGYPIAEKATAPPRLLSVSAFERQLWQRLQDCDREDCPVDLTLIVAPTNLFSLQLIDWIQHWNLKQHKVYANDVGDAWNIHKPALAKFLSTLFSHREHVIVLSGDIHYGSAVHLEYWNHPESTDATDCNPCVLVQLTSSAIKNSELKTRLVHTKLKSLLPEGDRIWIGWNHPPGMQEVTSHPLLPIKHSNNSKLEKRSRADWQYRTQWVLRQPAQTPAWGRSVSWVPPSNARLPRWLLRPLTWVKYLWRNRWVQDGHEVVGLNNLGVVSFQEYHQGDRNQVIQDLYWYAPWQSNRVVFSRFTASLLPGKAPKSNRVQHRRTLDFHNQPRR